MGRLAEEERGSGKSRTSWRPGWLWKGRRNWLDTPLLAPPPDPLPHRSSSPSRSHLPRPAEKSPLQAGESPGCEGSLKLGHNFLGPFGRSLP